MNGQRAVLFSTDPPYLVDYKGDDHPGGGKDWTNHYFDEDKSAQGEGGLYDGFISAARKLAITEDAAWYCWHASRRQMMVEQAWNKHGAFMHQQIIWVKDRPILTYSWYMWQHEPCMMGWIKGNKPKRGAKDVISGIWEYPSPAGDERVEHPTQKPVEVFIIPILQHTDPGDLCYEPFSGSGTQLVAAEGTGRICYALEKSPAFVGVALERLAGLGLSPRKVEGGQE
jgi:DNA modification methylase